VNWVLTNIPLVEVYLSAHLLQVVPAVLATLALSLPLARLAQRVRPLRALIVSGASLMYAIPSLALFVILPLVLGTGIRDAANVVVALTLYGLALLVPATADALDAVDARVLDPGRGAAPDLLVVNPPRRGIGAELAGRIEASGVRRVLYSSCNPQSLARDLRAMPSLGARRARLFDMFPHTDHAEVLVELVRRPARADRR